MFVHMSDDMHWLFSYGTLQQPEVQMSKWVYIDANEV